MHAFSYMTAFARNIGWVTEGEQQALRAKKVAIAGMGGVGGAHLLTLTRLGVGAFNVADFDVFDLVNFNRQVGATMGSIGRPKLDVMAEMALAINPELRIRRFADGVTPDDIASFLEGVDLFVDGFDFFELGIRRLVFRRCFELGIPAITAAPIGMGTNWLIFTPAGMKFDDYFGFEGCSPEEQYLRFLMGLAPHGSHRRYLVDPSRVDLEAKTGPSTGASCQLCAGVVGVEATKLLLRRGAIHPAPVHQHFDPFLGTYRRTQLHWGMGGPAQRVKLAVARRFYFRVQKRQGVKPSVVATTPAERVLELARWAPSGDNAQPWRFHLLGEDQVRVELIQDNATNPYEYRGGEPTLLSLGMLIETIRMAASTMGRKAATRVFGGNGAEPLHVNVDLSEDDAIAPDPLASFITMRSVHRWPMHARRLTALEKSALEASLSPDFAVRWFESVGERMAIARLCADVTDIRLRAPELFSVHQRVIDWGKSDSPHGLPAGALGLDRATLRVMRWGMASWNRMAWINRLSGTFIATAQLDWWPGLRSSAFFALEAAKPPEPGNLESLLRAGASIQRFWLTATKLGLALQPSTAVLMMAHHGGSDTPFTAVPSLVNKMRNVATRFGSIFHGSPETFLFLGRIGRPSKGPVRPRSVRRSWAELARRG